MAELHFAQQYTGDAIVVFDEEPAPPDDGGTTESDAHNVSGYPALTVHIMFSAAATHFDVLCKGTIDGEENWFTLDTTNADGDGDEMYAVSLRVQKLLFVLSDDLVGAPAGTVSVKIAGFRN